MSVRLFVFVFAAMHCLGCGDESEDAIRTCTASIEPGLLEYEARGAALLLRKSGKSCEFLREGDGAGNYGTWLLGVDRSADGSREVTVKLRIQTDRVTSIAVCDGPEGRLESTAVITETTLEVLSWDSNTVEG
jgi:hypothetical protein